MTEVASANPTLVERLTITEALAEIKTINKRIENKRNFVGSLLARQEGFKDPMERQGGSAEVVRRERQAIADLEERIITIRRLINFANVTTPVVLDGKSRSIQDWLTWRREIAPTQKAYLERMRSTIAAVRRDANQKNIGVITNSESAKTPQDVIINIDEQRLADEIEQIERILGMLDGQLSLKNATTTIEI